MFLDTVNISKQFGKKTVLSNITFSIDRGEIIGFIGPNGSGKTTLLNILMGMIKPTTGTFVVKEDINIGMSVSRNGFFDDMTVLKNIMLYSQLIQADEEVVLKLLDHFLIDFKHMRFGSLSTGMKQRVSLVLPFVRNNDLIYLDEPSNHLDIDSILLLRETILRVRKLGTSFLIASHNFSDLEKVCDRIIFLKAGMLVMNSSTIQLMQTYGNLENAYLTILSNK